MPRLVTLHSIRVRAGPLRGLRCGRAARPPTKERNGSGRPSAGRAALRSQGLGTRTVLIMSEPLRT